MGLEGLWLLLSDVNVVGFGKEWLREDYSREGFGEVRDEVGCEGRKGSGVGVGLWEGAGHDGQNKRFWMIS